MLHNSSDTGEGRQPAPRCAGADVAPHHRTRQLIPSFRAGRCCLSSSQGQGCWSQRHSDLPNWVACQRRDRTNFFAKENNVFLSVRNQLCWTLGRNSWLCRRIRHEATSGKNLGLCSADIQENNQQKKVALLYTRKKTTEIWGFVSSPVFRRSLLNSLLKICRFWLYTRPELSLTVMPLWLALSDLILCSGSLLLLQC